jgi:hypothetical protein
MFMRQLAVLMSRSSVLLGIFVLAECVVMLGLMMMMRRGVVVSGRLMMMLTRWMFRRLCHLNFLLLNRHLPSATSDTSESSARRDIASGLALLGGSRR